MSDLAAKRPLKKVSAQPSEPEGFTDEQIALIRRTVAKGAPDDELQVFLHHCERVNLDPLAKQIYLIPRGNNYTIQTSIDGMRLVADRTGRYAGSDRPVFGKDGDEEYAEVTVYKLVGGNPAARYGFTSVAFKSEYAQERAPMWKKMPKTMLAKCAEAQALRKAFPADLSGMYGSEEMDQAAPPVVEAEVRDEALEAEVVDQRQPEPRPQGNSSGASPPESLRESDQRIVVSEIEDMLQKAPDGFFEYEVAMVEYARESYEKALAVRKKMRRLLDEGKPSEDDEPDATSHYDDGLSEEERRGIEDSVDEPEDSGDTEGRPNKNDLPATRKQLNYLEGLVEDVVEDGVPKFEEMVGKRIAELTREEASEWIGRLSGKAG